MGLHDLLQAVLEGNVSATTRAVNVALSEGIPVEQVLRDGLISAMNEVGRQFERGDIYVPEMLVAAKAMQAGLALLKPQLVQHGVVMAGKVVLGTVKGDLHDIGKNLVGMMLEGAGFEVVDMGTDVPPERFAQAVREHSPQVVGMSALLTTTMQNMRASIEALEDSGVRSMVKVIVGGAPVSEGLASKIGADGYAPDAGSAVREVRRMLGV
jgi:5-methyltetrahydrofolate--homocysteine methyltransferase